MKFRVFSGQAGPRKTVSRLEERKIQVAGRRESVVYWTVGGRKGERGCTTEAQRVVCFSAAYDLANSSRGGVLSTNNIVKKINLFTYVP